MFPRAVARGDPDTASPASGAMVSGHSPELRRDGNAEMQRDSTAAAHTGHVQCPPPACRVPSELREPHTPGADAPPAVREEADSEDIALARVEHVAGWADPAGGSGLRTAQTRARSSSERQARFTSAEPGRALGARTGATAGLRGVRRRATTHRTGT